MPASAFRVHQDRIRELERLLGRKAMAAEILEEALDYSADSQKRRCSRCRYRRSVADVGGLRDGRRRALERRRRRCSFNQGAQAPWSQAG